MGIIVASSSFPPSSPTPAPKMNAEQFAHYIEELQADRNREELRREANADRYRILETHIRATQSCDGSSVKLVRQWVKAVGLARPYFKIAHRDEDTHTLVVATLTGSMRSCYEHFLEQQADRANVTWAAVQTH